MTKCLFLCSQAAKAAAEGAAKTADEADAATHEVKQEKVKKTTQHTKNRTQLSILSHKDCGFMKDGRHIRCAAGGNKNTKGQGGTDKRLRYRIPPLLIEELLL